MSNYILSLHHVTIYCISINIRFRIKKKIHENWYSINVEEPQCLGNYNSDFCSLQHWIQEIMLLFFALDIILFLINVHVVKVLKISDINKTETTLFAPNAWCKNKLALTMLLIKTVNDSILVKRSWSNAPVTVVRTQINIQAEWKSLVLWGIKG